MVSRIVNLFETKAKHILIGYTVAGYPSLKGSMDVIKAMVNGGVDMLEIGIPFSDPIADGPTIQRASHTALNNGMTPTLALELCENVRKEFDIPLSIMTYSNIPYRIGYDKFVKRAYEAGVDGLIIPDLDLEEAPKLKELLSKNDMNIILLVSPNTSKERIKVISNIATGFIYLVSVYGTTGARKTFEDYTRDAIVKVKRYSKLPLAVGFGISNTEHVRFMLEAGADAVIVGSAFIDAIDKGNVEDFTKELKRACYS
ncbi:MAG: tryptophan synthase subunit alpha [Candidatus Nitrosocaldaceae archaeon]